MHAFCIPTNIYFFIALCHDHTVIICSSQYLWGMGEEGGGSRKMCHWPTVDWLFCLQTNAGQIKCVTGSFLIIVHFNKL